MKKGAVWKLVPEDAYSVSGVPLFRKEDFLLPYTFVGLS